MNYRIEQQDIAELLDCSIATVRRRMREAGIERDDFPALVRWLYPKMIEATEKNDPKTGRKPNFSQRWKAIRQRQKEEKRSQSQRQLDNLALARAGSLQRKRSDLAPLNQAPRVYREEMGQDFPDYDR